MITGYDQCSWCGRRHRPQSLVRDPDRLEYMCPEYARGRPHRPGPWNQGMRKLLAEARLMQPFRRTR